MHDLVRISSTYYAQVSPQGSHFLSGYHPVHHKLNHQSMEQETQIEKYLSQWLHFHQKGGFVVLESSYFPLSSNLYSCVKIVCIVKTGKENLSINVIISKVDLNS